MTQRMKKSSKNALNARSICCNSSFRFMKWKKKSNQTIHKYSQKICCLYFVNDIVKFLNFLWFKRIRIKIDVNRCVVDVEIVFHELRVFIVVESIFKFCLCSHAVVSYIYIACNILTMIMLLWMNLWQSNLVLKIRDEDMSYDWTSWFLTELIEQSLSYHWVTQHFHCQGRYR